MQAQFCFTPKRARKTSGVGAVALVSASTVRRGGGRYGALAAEAVLAGLRHRREPRLLQRLALVEEVLALALLLANLDALPTILVVLAEHLLLDAADAARGVGVRDLHHLQRHQQHLAQRELVAGLRLHGQAHPHQAIPGSGAEAQLQPDLHVPGKHLYRLLPQQPAGALGVLALDEEGEHALRVAHGAAHVEEVLRLAADDDVALLHQHALPRRDAARHARVLVVRRLAQRQLCRLVARPRRAALLELGVLDHVGVHAHHEVGLERARARLPRRGGHGGVELERDEGGVLAQQLQVGVVADGALRQAEPLVQHPLQLPARLVPRKHEVEALLDLLLDADEVRVDALHELLDPPDLAEVGDLDGRLELVLELLHVLHQLVALVLLVAQHLVEMPVHLDAHLVLLDVHVPAPAVQLRLPVVLATHDSVQNVGPPRQRELHRPDLRGEVLGHQRLPRLELLEGRVQVRLDARVFLLDDHNLVLDGGQGADGQVLASNIVHDPNQLLPVVLQPISALGFPGPNVVELLLAQAVVRLEQLVQHRSRLLVAPLIRCKVIPFDKRSRSNVVHLANELLFAVHHYLNVVDVALCTGVDFSLYTDLIVQRPCCSHHICCILCKSFFPLTNPGFNVAMTNIVHHHFTTAVCDAF
mmetsp:Transcript_38133/g.79904  ORF Transcript_38133/g.79904 Transcript_38133/m.79904 type:complete len:645 (-) Transcript_38133:609-2543(-)